MTMSKPCIAVFLAAMAGSAQAVGEAYACLIEPYQKIEIRSSVEALIVKINVDRGDAVQKGDVLVELDASVEEATLSAAKYRAVMEGEVQSAETRVAYSHNKLKRREELVRQNLISEQERDDAYSELRLAEAELLDARDNRALSEIEETRLKALVEQRRLRSPFDGVVTERLRHPGELAQTGDGARAILKLAQVDRLRVEVVLPTVYYGKVRVGDIGVVSVVEPLQGEYEARVAVVDSVVDSASGTFGIRLDLPNPNAAIPAGVKCRVRFDARS